MSYRLPPEWTMDEAPQLQQGQVLELRDVPAERGAAVGMLYVPDGDGSTWRQFWVYRDVATRPRRRLGFR